jgi:hypothetical protein
MIKTKSRVRRPAFLFPLCGDPQLSDPAPIEACRTQISGFAPRKCHESFDFVLPNLSPLYNSKPFVLKRFERASNSNTRQKFL